MKRTVLALGLLLVVANSADAQCKNPVPLVGGQTAIYRGEVLDTPERLRLALQRPRIQKAFHEILDKANMADRYDEVIRNLEALSHTDKYPHAAPFVWMAMRLRATKKVTLLRDSCWGGHDDLEAWTFTIQVDGKPATFIVPTVCLNLAKLPNPPPPTCTLSASVNCSASDPAKITVKAAAQGVAPIRVDASGSRSDGKPVSLVPSQTANEWEVRADDASSVTFSFTGTATDAYQQSSQACTTQAAVCVKNVVPGCEKPPACNLKVTASSEELQIETGDSTQPFSIDVFDPDGKVSTRSSGGTVPDPKAGIYTVTLKATSADVACKPAICSSTVRVPPPSPPCCDSAWLLRGFALGAQAQGARQDGQVVTGSGQPAGFELGFGRGLGAGFELERRFSAWGNGGRTAGWGWTLGLWRADLATRWQIDFPSRFLLDHPRVPVTVATTGLNFHLPVQSWDLFIGPMIGFSRFNSGTYPDDSPGAGTLHANFKDTFTYGANLGFDAWLGKCWGLTGGVEYLKLAAKARFLDVNVDPLLVRLGFVYHF
jgi:hypothetical protein